MDFEERLKNISVGAFMHTLQTSPFHEYGPTSINRRVCGFLSHVYGQEATMWDVVVDGRYEWEFATGVGPKIIEALAKAINIEMGAQIVPTAVPTKGKRDEGYFWTKERLTEVAHKLDGGASYREVALHYGKSVDGMKAALKRYGMYKPRFSAQWQPIATAPKNDTDVLVLCGNDILIGSFCGTMWWIEQTSHEKRNPTHWMPLPPLPK